MTRKILLSLLGAGLAVALAAPAAAQSARGDRSGDWSYADSDYASAQARRDDARSERYDDRYDDRRDARRDVRRDHRHAARTVTIPTRYRATVFVTEDVVYSRRGPRQVCTVSVRGPEQRYVSGKQLRRIARNHCSRRAVISIRA